MIISINPTSYRNAIELINLNVDRITIGQPEFSLRNSCYLSIEETKELLKNKKNTKVIVLVNKIFFDTELQKLEQYLLEISKLDIDGIEFADYAVLQILYENNLSKNIYTIYNPETLVVSYQQFPFYLDNDIDEVFIAREINQLQINEIGHNKNNMKIGMQACGYSYMMQSR
jgi:collagenase-like PrtC family protease